MMNSHQSLRNGADGTSLALRTEGGSERVGCHNDAGGDGWLTGMIFLKFFVQVTFHHRFHMVLLYTDISMISFVYRCFICFIDNGHVTFSCLDRAINPTYSRRCIHIYIYIYILPCVTVTLLTLSRNWLSVWLQYVAIPMNHPVFHRMSGCQWLWRPSLASGSWGCWDCRRWARLSGNLWVRRDGNMIV